MRDPRQQQGGLNLQRQVAPPAADVGERHCRDRIVDQQDGGFREGQRRGAARLPAEARGKLVLGCETDLPAIFARGARQGLVVELVQRLHPDEQPADGQPEYQRLGEQSRIEWQARLPRLLRVAHRSVRMDAERDAGTLEKLGNIRRLSAHPEILDHSSAPRIERVEICGVAVPLAGPGFRNAYLTKKVQKSVVVRLTAEDGSVGLGNIVRIRATRTETVEQSLAALEGTLAAAVRHLDAANPGRVLRAMDAALPGFLDAKAAIEMACVDLVSRHLGIAVHAYLGGALAERLRFNAWIGVLRPEEAAHEARRWHERGFRSAKVKVGGGIEADPSRIRAIREAVGPQMKLRADANAGYSVEDAIALGRMLEPLDLQLFEQPVAAGDLSGMAKVRRSIGIPVMADESITDHASLIRVIRAGCADIVKLKVMKQGGLLGCRRMVETAAGKAVYSLEGAILEEEAAYETSALLCRLCSFCAR